MDEKPTYEMWIDINGIAIVLWLVFFFLYIAI